MKRSLTLLVIMEIQTKTTVRYYYIGDRQKLKILKILIIGKDLNQQEFW